MCGPAWRSCRTRVPAAYRYELADRGARCVPDRRARHRRAGTASWATGWSPSPRAIRSAPSCSPKSTVSNAFWRPTPTLSTTPRSTSSTTRWPTRCTRRGTSRRSRRASRCSPRSRSPATAPRRSRSPRPPQAAGVTVMEGFHYLFHPVDPPSARTGRRRHARRVCTTSRCGWRCPRPRPTTRGGRSSWPAAR